MLLPVTFTEDHVGKPDPALVITCPEVPAAPLSVRAVVRFADAKTGDVNVMLVDVQAEIMPDATVPSAGAVNTGEVRVLFVSVSVPVAVTRLFGVMIVDRVDIGQVGQTTLNGNPACCGTSRKACRYEAHWDLIA